MESLGKIRTRLRSAGFQSIKEAPGRANAILVDGARVEVKTSETQDRRGRWLINIHRHGELNESGVDAYLIVLDGLYVVLPAPLGVKVMAFSNRSLARRWARSIDNWKVLKGIAKAARKNPAVA